MKLFRLVPAILFSAVLVSASIPASAPVDVPTEIGIKIKSNLLEQTRASNEMAQLQLSWLQTPEGTRYLNDQQLLLKDRQDLEKLKTDAVTALKLDPKTSIVDVEALTVTQTPPPTPEPVTKVEPEKPPVTPVTPATAVTTEAKPIGKIGKTANPVSKQKK